MDYLCLYHNSANIHKAESRWVIPSSSYNHASWLLHTEMFWGSVSAMTSWISAIKYMRLKRRDVMVRWRHIMTSSTTPWDGCCSDVIKGHYPLGWMMFHILMTFLEVCQHSVLSHFGVRNGSIFFYFFSSPNTWPKIEGASHSPATA